MASIQPNIVDLDDLLIQITNINDNGTTSTTFTTAAAHGISTGDTVVITNCSTAGYNATVPNPSVTVTSTDVDVTGTSFTIATSLGAQNTVGTGQVMVDDVVGNNRYFTPEIELNILNSTFELKTTSGNLSVPGTGVTGQAIYSFFKERWKEVPSITRYAFPMLSITNEQFEIQNGWTPLNDTTRKLIRTAGWSELVGTTVNRTYSGVITLGTLGSTDQPYYTQDDSFTAVTQTTDFTGPVNEAVPIFMSATGTNDINFDSTGSIASTTTDLSVFKVGDSITFSGTAGGTNDVTVTIATVGANALTFNETTLTASGIDAGTVRLEANRAGYFQIYVRTRGKTYADANLNDIGVTAMTSIVYRFPVSNANDLNIKTTDDTAFAGSIPVASTGLTSDGTNITVTTVGNHGLYEGAPISISGTTNYNGSFTVAALDGVSPATKFTIASALNVADEGGGTVQLEYVDAMSVKYLPNPDSGIDNARIRGDWTTGVTYALGDIVLDSGDSSANGQDRWYYLDATTAGGVATGVSLAADTNNTWTLWSSLPLNDHGERQIAADGSYNAFTSIYDLNSGGTTAAATKEIAYEYAQYILRSTGTIDIGTSRNGDIADPLVYFIGSQLHTYADPSFTIENVTYPAAVYAADIAAIDKNSITFHDWENSLVLFPLTVTVIINFNDNLDTDLNSKYYAYYTTTTNGNNFGEADALLVKTDTDTDVFGSAFGQIDQRAPFAYAYDQDTTGGRTISPAGDVPITVVGIGLDKGQYVVATGTITRTGATISLVSPLERNYSDPAE